MIRFRPWPRTVALGLGVLGVLGVLGGAACDDAGEKPLPGAHDCLRSPECHQVLVVAHRGYHETHPENSLAAIRAAAQIGSVQVPLFADALTLARELGIMLYVDQKTDRGDLVLAEIQAGAYYDVALVRDELDRVATQLAADPQLLVMPPIESEVELEAVLAALPTVLIVEVARVTFEQELTDLVLAGGVKVQQDVMVEGDVLGVSGDYRGWKRFVEGGVLLLQTNFPQLLVPAVRRYNLTGVFPDDGPGLL